MTHITKMTILFFITLAMLACGKDDETNDSETLGGGVEATFSAKVGQADFNPEFITGFRQASINNILITGSTASAEQIQIFVPADVTPGNYDWGTPYIGSYQRSDADGDFGFALTGFGNITITQHNVEAKTISGNFNFTTSPFISDETVVTVSEGEFSVSYTDI